MNKTPFSWTFFALAMVCLLAAPLAIVSCKGGDFTGLRSSGTEEPQEFEDRLTAEIASRKWKAVDEKDKLDRATLEKSLALGTDFLLTNQKPEGNFEYMYDWSKGEYIRDDNQVRQAGALWGLALIHLYQPEARVRAAMDKSLNFFFEHSKPGPDGSLLIDYPGESSVSVGTVALVAMAIVDYTRSNVEITDSRRAELDEYLDKYLAFLVAMQLDNGQFSRSYKISSKSKAKTSSPYFDGETLLCLCKAAKYAGHKELIPVIEEAAAVMVREYAFKWKDEGKPDNTKGFYQWGTMSFWEYQDAGWKDSELYQDAALMLAHWMIHTHRTIKRTRNTAYAHEGLIHAYKIAKKRGNKAAMADIRNTCDKALHKLMTWQVGGPVAGKNPFLVANPTDDKKAIGGFMNHRKEPPLRIDVTQHQSHAMILALQNLY